MHVLLIEDDLDLGSALQRALKIERITSEWFRRTADAPHYPDVGVYDCALLDLTLPDGTGLDLLRCWRNAGIQLATIVITARTSLEERLQGLDEGADDYLCKPFATQELVSRIRAVVRRSARQASDVWEFDQLRIEPKRHVASLGGDELDLSQREYQLLVELAREHGNVVAKSTLGRRLNPLGEPLEPSLIEVHISNLRRKIGAERICTVRGVGYMLKT